MFLRLWQLWEKNSLNNDYKLWIIENSDDDSYMNSDLRWLWSSDDSYADSIVIRVMTNDLKVMSFKRNKIEKE